MGVELTDVYIVIGAILLVIIVFFIIKFMERKFKNREQLIKATAIKIANAKLKPSKKVKVQPDTDVKYYNALRTNKSKRSLRYWKDLMLDKKHPDKTLLINMEMVNGFHRTFIIKNIESQFKYMGKIFIVDNDLKYYNLDSKLYQLDYHENFTAPIKRVIPVEQIRKSIKASNMIPSQATNPALIEKFIQSKILESLMKGGQFIESLRKFSFYLIIIMSIAVIHLLLYVYRSGLLENLKVPGIN